jgi:hypothetical protein
MVLGYAGAGPPALSLAPRDIGREKKMSKLRLPAFHDIARVIGRDADETEAKLYEFYVNPNAAPFNYRYARTFSRYAFARAVPLTQILAGCRRERTKQGKLSNEEVLSLLWNLVAGRNVRTYSLAPQFLDIRKDLRISVALPFYFVENGMPCGFWLQPRKEYALSHGALGLLASIVKLAVLKDDFKELDFEVCDMSAPAKGADRKPTIYRLDSFSILSEAETREKLQLLAVAYDRCVKRGVQRSERRPKNPPATGPDLFPTE